jgi:NAD(P)-dependent dehydrogenase (short-subunit alcohol dehydrogenase family)
MKSVRDAVILIAGGTGYVGEGLVESFLASGATAVVPYRSTEKADALREALPDGLPGKLDLRPAIVSVEDSADSLVDLLVRDYGGIDGAVASLGGWYYGYSLHRMPSSDWMRIVENNLTSHFMFMRPVMEHFYARNAGEFVMVNGGAAEVPAPESGAISVVAAAQKMMAMVLREEAHGTGINVTSVVATQPIRTRERKIDNVDAWLSAREVGDYIGRIMAGDAVPAADGLHYLGTR